VRKAAKKLGRAEAAASGLDGHELETALHEVRKKAKRARYAADTVKPVYGKKLRKWRKNVKAVQSTLGEHQDTVVGRDVLRHLAIAGHGEGQNTFTFGMLYARDAETAEKLRERFAGEWRRLRNGGRPGWLR
jgi:CHAD domain-containing protein